MPAQGSTSQDDQENDIELDEQAQAEEPNPTLLSRYLAHLRGHATHTRLHLSGTSNTSFTLHDPSFIAPNAYWTAEEKNVFFHALAVHSRLRPDLIAEQIGTKTFADVCTYMNILEDGLAFNRHENTLDEPTAETFTPVTRDEQPIAHEISDKWVDFEDQYSDALAKQERISIAENIKRAREDEVKRRRGEIRARRGGGRLADNTRDREGEKARRKIFDEWYKQETTKWEKEDMLNMMDGGLMKALDSLVRQGEENRGPSGSELKAENLAKQDATQASLTTELVALQPVPFDESLIDPVLREPAPSSTAFNSPQPESFVQGASLPHTPDGALVNIHHTFNPQTPPFPHSRSTSISGTIVGSDRGQQNDVPEDELSPASRRRAMKRVYMRRKRAAATGTVVNESIAPLKRGRKPKASGYDSEDDIPADEGASSSRRSEADNQGRHPHPSGKTLPYRLRERLSNAGITPQWLMDEGVDLFHMYGLNKLMRTYNNLHDVPVEVNSEISMDTVRRLREEVVEFISEIARRAIVSKEQEIVGKMYTKAWRLGQNRTITAANVAHALSMTGETQTKRAHFQQLINETDFASDVSDEEGDEHPSKSPKGKVKQKAAAQNETEDEDEDEEEEADPEELSHPVTGSTPLHRVLFPPFVRLPDPSTYPAGTHSVLPYMPWPAAKPQGPDLDLNDDDHETDEEALIRELNEDSELDERDQEADKAHEEKLWVEFDLAHEVPDEKLYEDSEDEGRQRKRRKVVKTAEFVVDSDEEAS